MRDFQDAAEARPDKFLRYDGVKLLNESRALLAEQLNVHVSTVVMILNATTGINLVLRNLQYQPEDTIVYFSTSYGACQNIVLATMEFSGCRVHRIELEYPVSVCFTTSLDMGVLRAFRVSNLWLISTTGRRATAEVRRRGQHTPRQRSSAQSLSPRHLQLPARRAHAVRTTRHRMQEALNLIARRRCPRLRSWPSRPQRLRLRLLRQQLP